MFKEGIRRSDLRKEGCIRGRKVVFKEERYLLK
jgi:hypothetical protein